MATTSPGYNGVEHLHHRRLMRCQQHTGLSLTTLQRSDLAIFIDLFNYAEVATRNSAIQTELNLRPAPTCEGIRDKVSDCWQQTQEWARHNPDKIRFMQHMAHSPYCSNEQHRALMATSMTFLIDLLTQARAAGQIAPLPDPLVLNFCHSHFLATAGLFAEHPALAAQPDVQAGAFQILWQGLSRQQE